jgi:Rieske Fe-S protein
MIAGPYPDPGPERPAPDKGEPRWHQDFPIDVPQDNYVARRDFTKFMVLTSLAFVVGQVWIGVQNVFRRGRGRPGLMPIEGGENLAVGAALAFNYPGTNDPCILVRTGPGTGAESFVAYSQKCTHLSCAVRPDVASGRLLCPCHEGSFDLREGRPLAGPPRRPLPRVELRVQGGRLYAVGLEERTV